VKHAKSAERRKRKQSQRRSPQRSGSQATVEAIFEATARILAREGRAGLNTNRIAEVAGVSVGTLYGYFSDKDAILLAMARRELDIARDRVAAALLEPDPEVHPARRAIRALVSAYNARGRTRRILMETLFAHGGSDELARPVNEIAQVLARWSGDILPPGPERLSTVGLYVLTRAVDSVVRSATYESVDFMTSREFEDELIRLIFGFLGWPLNEDVQSP
jgi:AcrR family transcriptional regulator